MIREDFGREKWRHSPRGSWKVMTIVSPFRLDGVRSSLVGRTTDLARDDSGRAGRAESNTGHLWPWSNTWWYLWLLDKKGGGGVGKS